MGGGCFGAFVTSWERGVKGCLEIHSEEIAGRKLCSRLVLHADLDRNCFARDFVFPEAVHTTRSSNPVQCPSSRRASDPPRGRMTGSGQPAPLQGLQGATDEVLPHTPHRSPPTSSPKKPPANTRKNSRVMAVRFLTAGVRVYDHDGGRDS